MKCRKENKKVLRMVDIQTISVIVASASVIAGVIYYIVEIRHQTKIRQTDLVLRLYSTYNSREFAEAVQRCLAIEYRNHSDLVKKYGLIPSVNPDQIAFRMVSGFFEEVGLLLRRGIVKPDLVADLFTVRIFWEKIKPMIEGLRKQFSEPGLFCYFEYLYNEMEKREQQLQQKGVKNG
jgi:hypothetical protein